MTKTLYHGVCHYPELWSEEAFEQDIALMKKTGINLVRIGEFWWSKIEPVCGEYDLDYITGLLDQFYRNNISVILCTPTPTPPVWLTHGKPHLLHVDISGNTMIHGSRQHICTNNEQYQKAAANIIERIAAHVAKHPAVVMWQLDNEFKCHIADCYCKSCKEQWHAWLEKKYTTIDNLNSAWGTAVWSQAYQSFDQVVQPSDNTPFLHNPSIKTMYSTFHREAIAQLATTHANIIRKYTSAPITTNGSVWFSVDNELLFKYLDYVSFDTYAPSDFYHSFVFNCDMWRGLKHKDFLLLETSSSHTGALERQSSPHPNGYLAAEAAVCYGLGGIAFAYWLWRQQAYGAEINHSAVISAWGKPGIGYKNVLDVTKAKNDLEDFLLSTTLAPAELAMVYSDRAKLFMQTEPHLQNDYRTLHSSIYKTVLDMGIHRDIVPEGDSLQNYKILLTPFMLNISPQFLAKAKAFVENGGIWIVGPMTGGRTSEHTITTDSALGTELENIAGIAALYTFPIDDTGATGSAFGIVAPLGLWTAVFEPKQATVIGHINGGPAPGAAFITERKLGAGKVVIIGSHPLGEQGQKMYKTLIAHYANQAGIQTYSTTGSVITIPRENSDGDIHLLAVNMGSKKGGVHIAKNFVEIEPYGYSVVKV